MNAAVDEVSHNVQQEMIKSAPLPGDPSRVRGYNFAMMS